LSTAFRCLVIEAGKMELNQPSLPSFCWLASKAISPGIDGTKMFMASGPVVLTATRMTYNKGELTPGTGAEELVM
ncbi:MAG: hypothetical protein AAF485_06810, partial [Chloroflexota bacterium]